MDENTVKTGFESQGPMSEVYGYKNEIPENGASNPIGGGSVPKNTFFKNFPAFFWEFFKIVLIAIIIVLPIRYFIFQPFIVKGDSMVPNLHSGDYLIVDEISYRVSNPKRGDVVVLKYPLDVNQRFIKRVIGLPGETVEIKNGSVAILSKDCDILLAEQNCHNIILDEKKYLPNLKSTDGSVRIVLKEDEYFVMGDNRPFSFDSRMWGVLPKEDIIGKAVLRIFPLSAMTYIATPSY